MPSTPAPHAKRLRLKFAGRIIDHLGIQMYQSPTAAISEMVANAWDADAENVWVTLPTALNSSSEIIIKDDGVGMSFEECEDRYLNVGMGRRDKDPTAHTEGKDRPILGRKGIGKFAGFGIASIIRIETISEKTGEKTIFELNIDELRGEEYVSTGGEVDVIEYNAPNAKLKKDHGTSIILKGLTLNQRPSETRFARSMARRFMLHQRAADFSVKVNGESLPEAEEKSKIEFSFPDAYKADGKPAGLNIVDEWGEENLSNGKQIKWRFHFYEKPIDDEELQGISIFARGKLAQAPFFFNLSGGLGGQHGQEYLTGQVQADYLDELNIDIIAPERQRINWEHEESVPLLEWGQKRIKELLYIWRDKRGEVRVKELETKVAEFSDRLDKLPSTEQKTIKKALRKLAQIPTLNNQQFEDLGGAILTAWEQGRLHEIIANISETETLSADDFLRLLMEAQVLTALNAAEAVKTKLLTIGGLKDRIETRELENAVRDFIAKNPWLISPKWETYRVETGVRTLIQNMADEAGLNRDGDWEGRVDLVLSSGDHLLILEFMQPGLNIDWDHLTRFERYIRDIRVELGAITGGKFRTVTGYIVADKLARTGSMRDKITDLAQHGMHALDWATLMAEALAGWQEFLETLVTRSPEDERLKDLLTSPIKYGKKAAKRPRKGKAAKKGSKAKKAAKGSTRASKKPAASRSRKASKKPTKKPAKGKAKRASKAAK